MNLMLNIAKVACFLVCCTMLLVCVSIGASMAIIWLQSFLVVATAILAITGFMFFR